MSKKVLVTGGTGFLSSHILLQLLEQGYKVITTVRSLKSQDKVIDLLQNNGVKNIDNLEFAEADLSKDHNWKEAMKGCDYVLSVASPVFMDIPSNEEEAIRPALEGIGRILSGAKEAGVKRVVMTSNFGAVGFSNKDPLSTTTENNWTNPDEPGLSVYEKSKLLAEKAAWKFMEEKGGSMELVTINPVAILGPSLSNHFTGSFGLIQHLLDGSMKAVPNIPLNLVDVRDVADIHIRAMTNPGAKGQRFIASADGQISMPEIAEFLRKENSLAAQNVSRKKVPNWVLHLGSLFNKHAKEGVLLLRMNRHVSNQKARNILGWKPISTNEDILRESLKSLLKYGQLKGV